MQCMSLESRFQENGYKKWGRVGKSECGLGFGYKGITVSFLGCVHFIVIM